MLSLYASLAAALGIVPFSPEALARAQHADAPIALHFHSKSCGTCRLQAKAFEAMRADAELALTLLVVDFDEDRETSRAFRVVAPGALIVLRGNVERARLSGVVEPERLRAALRSAL